MLRIDGVNCYNHITWLKNELLCFVFSVFCYNFINLIGQSNLTLQMLLDFQIILGYYGT